MLLWIPRPPLSHTIVAGITDTVLLPALLGLWGFKQRPSHLPGKHFTHYLAPLLSPVFRRRWRDQSSLNVLSLYPQGGFHGRDKSMIQICRIPLPSFLPSKPGTKTKFMNGGKLLSICDNIYVEQYVLVCFHWLVTNVVWVWRPEHGKWRQGSDENWAVYE